MLQRNPQPHAGLPQLQPHERSPLHPRFGRRSGVRPPNTYSYRPASDLKVIWTDNTPSQVDINQLLPFEFELDNPTEAETQAILLLSIDEPGKGQNRRRSTYQLWQGKLKAGETKRVGKKIHFFDKTTQSKEPGIYHLTVTVNGQGLAQREFQFER